MSGFVYNERITGNSVLKGRMAFTGGTPFMTTNINLGSFAGKKVKIRFRYATSDGSPAIPGFSGWDIGDIKLSASASITNTAKLFYEKNNALLASSTAVTKIKGEEVNTDFVAAKYNETEALLTWQRPGEINGTYHIERSTDNGVTFRAIGTVKTIGNNSNTQSYSFKDAAPAEGLNLYRIHYIIGEGADRTNVKALTFDNLKAVRVYPNPAKDKIKISIPGNNKTAVIQLTDGLGKTIKTYYTAQKNTELNLPALPSGFYYLNITKTDGISRHKLVIE